MIGNNKAPVLVPTSYICRCGSRVMSATGDRVLMRREKVTSKMVEQKCTCGGTFQVDRPLKVVDFTDLTKLRITCKPCKVVFRKVTPHRFSCPSCNETALVNERSVWLFASASITVDYATTP